MPQHDKLVLLAAGAVAAVCVVPITAGIQLGSNGKIMWDNNCNFTGKDCRSMKAIPQVCGNVCACDSTCTDWIWNNYNGGTCWFKNGAQFAESVKWATNCGYAVSGNVKVQAQAQAPAGPQVQLKAPAGARAQAGPNPSGGPSLQVQPSSNSGLSDAEMGEMLTQLNAFRAQNGLNPLTVDNRLVASSALHSKDQADHCRMTHTGSDGSTLDKRIGAQGYRFATVTENVAAGQKSVAEVLTGWKNSPRHRANLLNSDVVNIGFAKAVNTNCNDYGTYWTQDFGRLG